MVRLVSQRQPQHLAGLSFVVLLHVLLIYAFLNGLASHRSADVPAPLEVRLVEQQKKPLLPDQVFNLKPKMESASSYHWEPPTIKSEQKPFEVPQGPPGTIDDRPVQPPGVTIVATGPANQLSGSAAGRSSAETDCSNVASFASWIEYPARARRLGIQQGQVNVEFSVAAGGSLEIDAVTASNPVFEAAALDAVRKLHCSTGRYRLPISFVLQD